MLVYLLLVTVATQQALARVLSAEVTAIGTPPRVLFGYGGTWCYNGNYHNQMKPRGVEPPINPSSVPVAPGVETWIAMQSARDFKRDGYFSMGPNAPWTPATIAAAKIGRKFSISVAGSSFPWQQPSNMQMWQANAVSSLSKLIETYDFDGLDIKYEESESTPVNGVWYGFADSWCQVFSILKAVKSNLTITLAPQSGTAKAYGAVYYQCPNLISWINWQTYKDKRGKANQLASVNSAATYFGGLGNIVIGLVTDDTDTVTQQGTGSYGDAMDLVSSLPNTKGASTWQLENSYVRSYTLENMLYKVLA